jgi:hypothetical protein
MSEEQAAEQSDTLLDSAEPTLAEGEYYLTDGIKGTGEVPEWLDTKYKSVADQAKGYSELSKKFGGFKGSPKDGYTPPEGIESDDALYQELEAFATKTNMSADAFGEAWELLSAQDYAAQAVDQEEELSKYKQLLLLNSQWREGITQKVCLGNLLKQKCLRKMSKETSSEVPILTMSARFRK